MKALPLDIATRVWDNYFLRGDSFLYATITGVLSYLAPQLENGSFDECLQLLTHLPQVFFPFSLILFSFSFFIMFILC